MLSWYFDHHVRREIAEGLERLGIDILTAAADGAAQWSDDRLLARAAKLDRILFTQDTDFLILATEWQASGRDFAGIVFAAQQGITIGQAVADLELISRVCEPTELMNRVEFLPL